MKIYPYTLAKPCCFIIVSQEQNNNLAFRREFSLMPAPYLPASAANSILSLSEERGIALSPMKLQKLLYLSHGYYLATTSNAWIDEAFEAWDYGPVVPSIYHEFKRFGSANIERGTRCTALVREPSGFRWETPEGATVHDDIGGQVVNYVLNTYGGKSAIYLSELTHKVGSPWDVIRQNTQNARNQDIPNGTIREYFGNLIAA